MKKIAVVYSVLSFVVVAAFGQVNSGLLTTLSAVAGMRDRVPIEKVYLQLDKPYYSIGDTLRFKAYLLKGDLLKASTRSGILYVELDDESNRVAKRIMVPLSSGIGWGDIALDDNNTTQGSYTIRACTNWMLNFGEDYIFKKSIYIAPVDGGTTLVKGDFKLEDHAGKDKINASVYLTDLTGKPSRLKDYQLRIFSGYKSLFKDVVNTGMDGVMRFNFDLADKTPVRNLNIQVQAVRKGLDSNIFVIPVAINRPENTDIQFMPEGGNLVAGIPVKIGFKAISEDGKGLEITGKVYDSKQREVTTFRSTHKGMGTFDLVPQAGQTYMAKVVLPGNMVKNYPLPVVNTSGTAIKIIAKGTDSLEVTLSTSNPLPIATGSKSPVTNYYLVAQTRGLICYSSVVIFNGPVIKKTVPKNLFPTGIAHFTLLNNLNQPLNERIVFIDHDDNLHVSITADKPKYTIRDSIAINIAVKDKDGKPVRGNFSLAVTDASQVRADSTGNNIISNLLLTSDLKGTVEEPGYYFNAPTPQKLTELDNLLLTQGWIGYDWKAIFNPVIQPLQHLTEPGFEVQGRLTNVFNNPLKNAAVALLQKEPMVTMETSTDNEGRFVFKGKNIFPTDSAFYLVQAKNNKGEDKNFDVGIEVEEFKPPIYSLNNDRMLPWYFNSDTILLNNTGTKMTQLKAEAEYMGEGHMLKEVNIRATKIVPGSHNLNGPGGADVIFNEKEMNADKNITLYDLLKQKFKDFHKIERNGHVSYYLDYGINHIFGLRIDGVYTASLRLPQELFMEGLKASDIKGIELMMTGTWGMAYALGMNWLPVPPPYRTGMIFIEITTYSGHGAFIKNTPGRFIYRPVDYFAPKQFYSPKYTVKNRNIAMGTDLRSTIYWVPNLITDKDGKATVSFYSADMPADYTLTLEGTDMNGSFGYSRQKIKVVSTTTAAK